MSDLRITELPAIDAPANADVIEIVDASDTGDNPAGSSKRTTVAELLGTPHSHTSGNITDFAEAVDDRVAVLLQPGSNITLTYNDLANTLTINGAAGVTDHGALSGLADDDHPQYALADKSRPATWVSAADLGGRSLADLGTRVHAALTGLTSGDDHTQYALLAGRSGGQTLKGGTAAGENITIQSTAHATKGKVYLNGTTAYVDASNNLVIAGVNASNNSSWLGFSDGANYLRGITYFGSSNEVQMLNGGFSLLVNSGEAKFAANVRMTGLPTTNPGIAGRLWNNGGVLNIS